MDIIETIKFKNIPKKKETLMVLFSQSYDEFVQQNPDININEIHIVFIGGTPTKEIVRESK